MNSSFDVLPNDNPKFSEKKFNNKIHGANVNGCVDNRFHDDLTLSK